MSSAGRERLPAIVNSVLCYSYARLKQAQQASREEVCDSLFLIFENWEFGRAKDVLWEHIARFRSDDMDIIGEKQKRNRSSTRSAAVAHCLDVLTALQDLEEAGALPELAAEVEDLMELPPITPQPITQKRHAAIDKHLSLVEEELHQSQDAMKETLICIQETQRKMVEELAQLHQRLDASTPEPPTSTPVVQRKSAPVVAPLSASTPLDGKPVEDTAPSRCAQPMEQPSPGYMTLLPPGAARPL